MRSPNREDNNRSPSHREFRCPACKRVVRVSEEDPAIRSKYYPFCSERCKLIDLGAWLDAGYRIPSREDEESEEPPSENPPSSQHSQQ